MSRTRRSTRKDRNLPSSASLGGSDARALTPSLSPFMDVRAIPSSVARLLLTDRTHFHKPPSIGGTRASNGRLDCRASSFLERGRAAACASNRFGTPDLKTRSSGLRRSFSPEWRHCQLYVCATPRRHAILRGRTSVISPERRMATDLLSSQMQDAKVEQPPSDLGLDRGGCTSVSRPVRFVRSNLKNTYSKRESDLNRRCRLHRRDATLSSW
jgi:hypothetical protein